ncbi:MAG: hypothetical protein LBU65_05435 [Planctomycetaceae bacterium]|jgi:hypothetical protein|nr:hypothetical protein [Planctomycetaceae bacterium]
MQPSFIAAETNTNKLYQLNSFLKRLAAGVDWEAFRPLLSVSRKPQPNGGRPSSSSATAKRFRTFSASLLITPFPMRKRFLAS